MKRYLLPPDGAFYKTNLHCHSTVSPDGKFSPEEIKQAYKAKGYAAVAFTDHERFQRHSELCDDTFIALNGVEVGVLERLRDPHAKHCHLCFLALTPEAGEEFWCEQEHPEKGRIPRVYNTETVNALIKRGKELGFFVTYNHPGWSLENYNDYMAYHGMDAIEIFNTIGINHGHLDHVPHVYDDMLRGGKRLFCIGADDNHGTKERFGAFTMIKAPSLTYTHLTEALSRGHCYASQGPEIHDLWVEDGHAFVATSPAKRIFFTTGGRRQGTIANADATPVCEGCFALQPDDGFFRVTVLDENGCYAHSNAYFIDEL